MNIKVRNFIKNFYYTLSSNLITLIISTILILIVPKLIGVKEYSYWQLYAFYSSYVGFLQFGWNDGIYLRYGGEEYNNLDKKLFFSQFMMMCILQVIIFTVFLLIPIAKDKVFVLRMTAICMVLVNLRGMIVYILQGTNRIREYARITTFDRLLYIALVILLLMFGIRSYEYLIVVDIIGKFVALVIGMFACKDMIFHKISYFKLNLSEAFANINVGIKLMFANIASMLIVGTVRFGIERGWDVATFGKVSLTLSVSNLLMVFINAVGIIMFPILRRTDRDKLPSIYVTIREFLTILMLGVLVCYYPIKIFLYSWLPQYAESLKYMALLFPMSLYEGKMALLVNTYLKTLRKEKMMLRINVISFLLSIVITILTTIVLKNLDFAIFSIIILLGFRCILAEVLLSKIVGVSIKKDTLLEMIEIIIFIFSGWILNSIMTIIIYTTSYILYLILKKKDICKMITKLKLIFK